MYRIIVYINIIDRYSNVAVSVNENEIVDTLICNYSSGFIDVFDDSLQIEILDNLNNHNVLYDTLCYLEKEKSYTLFLIKKSHSVSALLVHDLQLSSPDVSFIRIFNNSAAGEPFIFRMRSMADTLSFVSLPLHGISSYHIMLDTLYTPSISLILSGLGGEYDPLTIERDKRYLLIFTDTFSGIDIWYPYVLILFEDMIDNKKYERLL